MHTPDPARSTAGCASRWAVIAPTLLGTFALVSDAGRHTQPASPAVTYSTEIGELKRVASVGSAVASLNTGSLMIVSETSERCEMVLERGEALFELKSADHRRLRVTADKVVVEAEGSTFSVRRYDSPGRVDVMVREGSVLVVLARPATSSDRSLSDADPRPASMRVSANQLLSVSSDGLSVRSLRKQDVARRLAWTSGYLFFRGETLQEITTQLNRYNRRKLVIADPSIGSRVIGGQFRSTDLASFVAALEPFGVQALNSEASGRKDGSIRLVDAKRRQPGDTRSLSHSPTMPPSAPQ